MRSRMNFHSAHANSSFSTRPTIIIFTFLQSTRTRAYRLYFFSGQPLLAPDIHAKRAQVPGTQSIATRFPIHHRCCQSLTPSTSRSKLSILSDDIKPSQPLLSREQRNYIPHRASSSDTLSHTLSLTHACSRARLRCQQQQQPLSSCRRVLSAARPGPTSSSSFFHVTPLEK